jgi:hypothetical protein
MSVGSIESSTIGLVGIGTTTPVNALDVRGDNVTIWDGSATVDQANQEGDLYVEHDLEVDGYTYFKNLDVDGEVEADNLPGCEFTTTSNLVDVPTSWTNVTSASLNLSASGYVIVTFSGYTRFDTAGDGVYVGIGGNSTSTYTYMICNSQSMGDYIPFSVQYVATISSAGTYTYYGNAKSMSGTSNVYSAKIVALYVPNRY